jgi:RNA polymerase sigma-70 factor (ECF subfamily)
MTSSRRDGTLLAGAQRRQEITVTATTYINERRASAAQNTTSALLACPDADLMKQIRSGQADAFEELYDRYAARAYRVARSVCSDHGRAEDAVQEAFAAVWHNRAAYLNERGTVAAWLLSVVRYRSIDIIRRDAKHANHQAGEEMILSRREPGENMADRVVARIDAGRLHALLQRLPDYQREVIVLAYYGELTHREIAAELGLPAGTVKGRMRLGLEKLRTDIGPGLT